MIKLTFGKKGNKPKKFKSVGENKLSVSDMNFIRNNSEKFSAQQISQRIGKTVGLIDDFMIKNGLKVATADTSTNTEIAEAKATKEKVAKPASSLKKPFASKEAIGDLEGNDLTQEEGEVVRAYILSNYKKQTTREMGKFLDKSPRTIRYHLYKMGLKPVKPIDITKIPKVAKYLKENYRTRSTRELANDLNYSFDQVRHALVKMNCIRTPEETKALKINWRKYPITDQQKEFIEKNYGILTFQEIADKLAIRRSTVINHVYDKNLTITEEQRKYLFNKTKLKNT